MNTPISHKVPETRTYPEYRPKISQNSKEEILEEPSSSTPDTYSSDEISHCVPSLMKPYYDVEGLNGEPTKTKDGTLIYAGNGNDASIKSEPIDSRLYDIDISSIIKENQELIEKATREVKDYQKVLIEQTRGFDNRRTAVNLSKIEAVNLSKIEPVIFSDEKRDAYLVVTQTIPKDKSYTNRNESNFPTKGGAPHLGGLPGTNSNSTIVLGQIKFNDQEQPEFIQSNSKEFNKPERISMRGPCKHPVEYLPDKQPLEPNLTTTIN